MYRKSLAKNLFMWSDITFGFSEFFFSAGYNLQQFSDALGLVFSVL